MGAYSNPNPTIRYNSVLSVGRVMAVVICYTWSCWAMKHVLLRTSVWGKLCLNFGQGYNHHQLPFNLGMRGNSYRNTTFGGQQMTCTIRRRRNSSIRATVSTYHRRIFVSSSGMATASLCQIPDRGPFSLIQCHFYNATEGQVNKVYSGVFC